MSGAISHAWKPNGSPSGFAAVAVPRTAAVAAMAARNSRLVTCPPKESTELACRGDVPHPGVAKPLAQLRQIQAARRNVPIERLDVAVLLRRVLERNVEDDRVDPDMTERVVLRRRRLLHEEVAFAVPEHRVRACPSDRDVLPEARRQRRLHVVVDAAIGPVLVRLA